MFLHPLLAILGIGAVSVPIIIHLLNRRRFKVIQWGAMSFLLNAYKKTRRRLQLENLILLLLRALAVLLLGLGIARPRLSEDTPLIQIGSARRDVIIAVDASWSMAHRSGANSNYERALAEARRVLDSLKPDRQDRATVILAKQKPVRVSASSIQSARDALARANEPSFESLDLAATLELVASEADAFAPEGPDGARSAIDSGTTSTLVLITDLQRSNFFPKTTKANETGSVASSAPAASQPSTTPLQAAAMALSARKVSMRIVDVGSGAEMPDNVGITRVYSSEDFPATGLPVELRAAVRNHGGSPKANITVQCTVDGNRESPQTIDSLAPGAEREVLFNLIFREAGDHAVEISIEEDQLAPDDKRSFVMSVRPPLRVLLVDGSPTGELETSAAGMLALAIAPPEEPVAASPFQLVSNQPVDRARFASQPELLDQADSVVLANVEGLSDEQAARLSEYVESGGSVVFVLGNNIDPNSYSLRLRAGDNPNKWMFPGTILKPVEVPSREHPPFRIANLLDPLPGHLKFFEPAERRVLITEIPVFKFLSVEVASDDVRGGAQVLARYNDPELSPFLISKDLGRGRVAVITTSLDLSPDQRWSRIAESPKTFLPFIFDLLHTLAAGNRDDRNSIVGKPLRNEVRGYPRSVMVVDPAAKSEKITIDEKKKIGLDRYPIEYTKTERPGIYQMEVETAGGVGTVTSQTFRFAAGVDPEEGNLARIRSESVGSAMPGLDVRVGATVDPDAPPPSQGPQKNEIWPLLIMAAIAVLVLEMALATLFGRRRS
ncbi:MAG: BatA domain-containing protein [Planctomycetota bacterium]